MKHSALRAKKRADEDVDAVLIKKKKYVDDFAAFDDRVTDQSLKETGPPGGSLPSAYTNRTGHQHQEAREIVDLDIVWNPGAVAAMESSSRDVELWRVWPVA